MANRCFGVDGFWDRVEIACQQSDLSKAEIARRMGCERKCLYEKQNGSSASWHSGRLVSFCQITGVSADWLLGLSRRKKLKGKTTDPINFRVIDTKTGKEPLLDLNHVLKEKWFKNSNLIWCDLEGWMINEDGYLILADECGNYVYPPQDRFRVEFI